MPRKPRISVTERGSETTMSALMSDPRYRARLQNPFNEPSAPITLVDNSRECRWFNAAKGTDHIWRSKRKGWDQVKPSDVADLEQIGGYNVSPEGYITRGERGQEVLMSMPKDVRIAIQTAKTRQNTANMGNPHAMKNEVVAAAGERYGDEGASYISKHVDVTDTYERVERVEPE
jgi:hypothetical protein